MANLSEEPIWKDFLINDKKEIQNMITNKCKEMSNIDENIEVLSVVYFLKKFCFNIKK